MLLALQDLVRSIANARPLIEVTYHPYRSVVPSHRILRFPRSNVVGKILEATLCILAKRSYEDNHCGYTVDFSPDGKPDWAETRVEVYGQNGDLRRHWLTQLCFYFSDSSIYMCEEFAPGEYS